MTSVDGVRRMGKSLGNYIGVAESAENQFGKIMSIPDEPLRPYFTLLTELPMEEIDKLLAPGVNPRDAKEVLAKLIVSQYHPDNGSHQHDMPAGSLGTSAQVPATQWTAV